MTTSGKTNDKEWYNEWHQVVQQMTTNVQRVTASGVASDNEWQGMTTSKKKWQWVTVNDSEP